MKTSSILDTYQTWLTHREYSPATIQKYTKALARFFADTGAGDIPTRETVAAWRDSLTEKGYTPATVNAMLAAVNDYQESIDNVAGKAKPLKHQRRIFADPGRELTRAEYFRLLNAARAAGNKRTQLLLEALCSTGTRVSELQFITAEAVRRHKASIRCKGKSMSAKEEIVQIALSTEDDILILDPESEFGYLTEALGGEVIRISATSDTHINALDMDRAYGDERNPIVSKSEFVLSLFEQLIGDGMVTAKEKSILGRCTEQVYLPYIRNGYKGTPPTLQDFYRLLQMQPEPEAQGLALSSELFITGTLNTFARHTNVDTQARIIAYDIRELGEQLMPLGMLVTLDAIYNRVIQNWKKGRRTWIFCDEFYILFRYEYSANFFYKLWKRIRKYNGLVTGLTQNVDELLRSDTARLMLANSEFLVMLNQSATDRAELAKLLNISDNQLGYVTNVPAGCGLIRCAGNIVPFTNSFPKNTKLYKLMSTNPSERKE